MNLLDKWWNGLDLDENRMATCKANEDCMTCPLLYCEGCDDPDNVRLFIEKDKEGDKDDSQ